MLIIPAENRFDVRRLPFGTFVLVLVCMFCFVGYQAGDVERIEHAMTVYSDGGLLAFEEPLLQSYLDTESVADRQQLRYAALERGFDQYLRDYWRTTTPTSEWVTAREQFEQARDAISWHRFGLVPADVRPAALLGHMFLHADAMHLLGNMIFLLLFGMLLERVVGSALFMATYFLTGTMAAGLFTWLHSGSGVPLIGASGAISGLMGAYLGVYGLRKVQFFYTVGFWFGRFTAPALLVFPLWLAKELHGHFAGEGPVAYMAHAGGLAGGLLLALVLRKPASHVLDRDRNSDRASADRQERLVRIRHMMTDMRLAEATRLIEQSLKQAPGEGVYWEVYAEVASKMPLGGEYQRIMKTVFMNARNKALELEFLRAQLVAYQQRCGNEQPALDGAGGAALARRYFREGRSRDLDSLLDSIFRRAAFHADFRNLLNTLLQFAEKNNDQRRAARYRKYLATITETPGQALAGPS